MMCSVFSGFSSVTEAVAWDKGKNKIKVMETKERTLAFWCKRTKVLALVGDRQSKV